MDRQEILGLYRMALGRLDPEILVSTALERMPPKPTRLVALGKAAPAMARGAATGLGEQLIDGLVVCDHREPVPERCRLLLGSHPRPDHASVEAGHALLEYVEGVEASERLLVLVSGGGSAIAEVPKPGLRIDEIARLFDRLTAVATPIEELNTVRRHLSLLKNGGLAAHSTTSDIVTLALSDVPGGPASAIASGPTTADASVVTEAREVLIRRLGEIPRGVEAALGSDQTTPVRPVRVLADSTILAETILSLLRQKGLDASIWTDRLDGEASARAREMIEKTRPATCLIATGETTVTLTGDGVGGRNLEAALAAALAIDGRPVTFAALATDGRDGPTPAAGAIVDGGSAQRIRDAGLDPAGELAAHNSYPVLDTTGDAVVTGPSGNNLGDLWICVSRRPGREVAGNPTGGW